MSWFGLEHLSGHPSGHLLGHPLDVDLADLVDGVLDDDRAARVEAHLTECLSCRVKLDRLLGAAAAPPVTDRSLPSPTFLVPTGEGGDANGPVTRGDLWLAGSDVRILVVVVDVVVDVRGDGDGDDDGDGDGGRILVAPVTFDIEAADDETRIVDGGDSPLQTALAVYPRLATELPREALGQRIATFGPGAVVADLGRPGAAIVDASDPRLEVRQHLADRLGSIEEQPPDPGTATDAPLLGPEHVRSSLISDLRALRGGTCSIRPLLDWGDVLPARRAGWEPIATIDEVGIVLVVFDTPHGLVDDADFDAARAVLTRSNGTALVVLARELSDLAEVYDSSSLNHGIDAPSGRHTPPRPLISGLSPFDAIAKFLDQTTGARATAPASRGPVTRVDVGEILREAAGAALVEAVRQGSRFKTVPKRRGYESLADDAEPFEAALGRAFGPGTVVEGLLDLAPRNDG